MVIKLVLCALACAGAALAADELLEALAGERGDNRLTVCMERRGAGGGECAAALWRSNWAVARASCVARRPLRSIRVLHTARGYSCDTYAGNSGWRAGPLRRVVRRSVHPYWRAGRGAWDVALLTLDAPFGAGDSLANLSAARAELDQYGYWMNAMYEDFWTLKSQRTRGSFSEDMFLLLITMVLPGGAFCAFFLFVTFCTGTPVKVPYSNVDEPVVITSWTPYPQKNMCYSKGVKCYPTYGQV